MTNAVLNDEPIVFLTTTANDNFTDDELPTSVPPGKAREHAELAALMDGKPVTICPTVKPVQDDTPWTPLKAANDNQAPLSWPLAEALRRAGKEADIEVCEHYRGLSSIMAADPLQGRDVNMAEGEAEVSVESRSSFRNGDDGVSGSGELSYKGVRQLARTPGASTKAVRQGDGDAGARYSITTAKFSERTLIAQIDNRGIFARLRAAIRPLLSAFEDACLDGMTLTEIGEARGFKDKQASAAGKALVFEAVGALAEEWHAIRQEERALEQQAERNVIRFRAKLAERDAVYLGKAA